MSKFFEGVKFTELEPKKVVETVKESFPDDFQKFLPEFVKLLAAIESGQSTISPAIDLRKAPVKKALERLSENPNALALELFLNMAEQDINLRAKREIIQILFQNPQVKSFIEKTIPGVIK